MIAIRIGTLRPTCRVVLWRATVGAEEGVEDVTGDRRAGPSVQLSMHAVHCLARRQRKQAVILVATYIALLPCM